MFKKKLDYSVNEKKYGGECPEIEKATPARSAVLDLGCSTGKLARALKRKRCKVTGVDIDGASLRQAAKYCEKTYKIDLDHLNSFDDKLKGREFDVITAGDIFEHIKYPGVLLYHLKKYLNPDGVIITTIPNSGFIWLRLRFLFGNFFYNQGGGLMDEDHLRFFSFKSIRRLFEEAGYKLVDFRGSNHGIVNPNYWPVKIFAKIWPTLFSIHVFVVAKAQKK